MNSGPETPAALLGRFFGRDRGALIRTTSLPCGNADTTPLSIADGIFKVDLIHKSGDARGVGRLLISRGSLKVELLPSKGLSVGEAWSEETPFFWDPPIEFLPDPDQLDPDRTLIINGEEMAGLGFLEAFAGGVEMLGLKNWGMPYHDAGTGENYCLHGDVAMRPVASVEVSVFERGLVVTGIVNVRNGAGDSGPWYDRGSTEFAISKSIVMDDQTAGFFIVDRIQNCGSNEATPDWGYHVQLRAAPGATYLVPSTEVETRGEDALPDDFREWIVPEDRGPRTERGFIHRKLRRGDNLLGGNPGSRTLLRYRSGTGILAVVPPSPFFLAWFSAGGELGTEFMAPGNADEADRKVFSKPWNGVGPEIGASSLDHDGSVDTDVPVRSLKPGEGLELAMMFQMLGPEETEKAAAEILTETT